MTDSGAVVLFGFADFGATRDETVEGEDFTLDGPELFHCGHLVFDFAVLGDVDKAGHFLFDVPLVCFEGP